MTIALVRGGTTCALSLGNATVSRPSCSLRPHPACAKIHCLVVEQRLAPPIGAGGVAQPVLEAVQFLDISVVPAQRVADEPR